MAEKPDDEDVFYDVIDVIPNVIHLDSIQHHMVDDGPNDQPRPKFNDEVELEPLNDHHRNEPQPEPLKSKPMNDEYEPQPETLNDRPEPLNLWLNDQPRLDQDLVSLARPQGGKGLASETNQDRLRPQKLTIFVIGQTGAGKSTLINSLLKLRGKNQAFVTHGMYPGNHDMLERHEGFFCEVPTTLYDSRGLGDPLFNSAVFLKKFGNAIREHEDQYLVFICQDFNSRWDNSVVKFVRLMARKFKRNYEIWKKSILILTKANNYTYQDTAEGDSADEDTVKEDTLEGDSADEDTVKEDTLEGDTVKGDIVEKKELTEDMKRLKMMLKTKDWCVRFRTCLTLHGVPEEIIARMLVCPTGNEKTEIALFDDWKAKLLELCIEAQNDWDIYRRIKSPRRYFGEIAGGVIPVFGPPIGMAIEALLAEESKKKEIKKCEEKEAKDEALDFESKEKNFASFFKRILNRR